MRKDLARREFLKLKFNGYSYPKCQELLFKDYGIRYSIRTLFRWKARFEAGDWNLRDISQRPNKLQHKFSQEDQNFVRSLREKTGFSSYQLKSKLKEKGICMSESTIKRIVKDIGLSRGSKIEGMRLKWVRFERHTPNSMWQMDGTTYKGEWLLPIEDDCSRYCLAIGKMKNMTTQNVIALLTEAIAMHGKPREILTDNGSEFGGTSIHSEFDKWCRKQGIHHIRSGIHKPTTVGKISRLQFTIVSELPYCFNDLEYFRYRYNCERPHRSLNGLTPNQVFFGWKKHKKYLLSKKQMIEGI